jgi:non-heme chloroperoxidase
MAYRARVASFVLVMTACAAEVPAGDVSSDVAMEPVASVEQRTQLNACGGSVAHRIALTTGVELAYWEQGSKHGDVVIFVPGYTDSHHSFDRILPRFPKAYHVLALDMRGHGESSKPACCYTQADFAADIAAFMDAKAIDHAAFVGHSMGSFIVQQVALDYPKRVERIVLIGSAPTVSGNQGVIDLMSAVDTLEDPIDPSFVRDFQASTFYRPIPASFLETAVEDSLKVPASVWKQALFGLLQEDHSSRLPGLAAPTLILNGDQDALFSPDLAAQLNTLIPKSKMVIYPMTGHAPHVEVPAQVTRDIDTFLHLRR